jgi:hypothetical protein
MMIFIGVFFVIIVGLYFTINNKSVGQLQARSNVLDKGFCAICGDQLEIDALFCSNCGTNIKKAMID